VTLGASEAKQSGLCFQSSFHFSNHNFKSREMV